MTRKPDRSPAAFRLSDPAVLVEEAAAQHDGAVGPVPGRTAPKARIARDDEDPFAAETVAELIAGPPRRRRGIGWGKLFFGAAGALASFAIGIWITDFVTSLFQRNDLLGWIALALAGLTGIALLALVAREAAGLMRLARVTQLRTDADAAAASDDREAARRIAREAVALYASRPETARGRAEVAGHAGEIIDGRDLLRLAERNLMTRYDMEAKALITAAAGRVSVVTAISPRAFVDIAYVLIETTRLVRRIGMVYGGRPSGLALLRLLRLAIAHLAVTGGVAMTDGLVQQLVGHGLAARLSARLGEGVVNGMMTARIGLAAQDVCRPLPWLENKPPGLSDVMSVIARAAGEKAKKGD
ncbi:TIGR01620 family protein [Microbaculum marinum]|uniref:TIGR01620 family protein n=1 Tax=Microbaculum marinum TaxID=1764581 RepID=A0AAW9S2L7_9HYPH